MKASEVDFELQKRSATWDKIVLPALRREAHWLDDEKFTSLIDKLMIDIWCLTNKLVRRGSNPNLKARISRCNAIRRIFNQMTREEYMSYQIACGPDNIERLMDMTEKPDSFLKQSRTESYISDAIITHLIPTLEDFDFKVSSDETSPLYVAIDEIVIGLDLLALTSVKKISVKNAIRQYQNTLSALAS